MPQQTKQNVAGDAHKRVCRIVRIFTGSRQARRDAIHYFAAHDLDALYLDCGHDSEGWFRVEGTEAALQDLLTQRWLLDVHEEMSGGVPERGAGQTKKAGSHSQSKHR